jgi:hypothetical protein
VNLQEREEIQGSRTKPVWIVLKNALSQQTSLQLLKRHTDKLWHQTGIFSTIPHDKLKDGIQKVGCHFHFEARPMHQSAFVLYSCCLQT